MDVQQTRYSVSSKLSSGRVPHLRRFSWFGQSFTGHGGSEPIALYIDRLRYSSLPSPLPYYRF